MKNIHKIKNNIYITNNEEIKEGDLYLNNNVIFKADDIFNEGNNPNNSNPRVTDFNKKIIITMNMKAINWLKIGLAILVLSAIVSHIYQSI